MPVTMYHTPRCNTSRRTLALLRENGVEPSIIEYLKTPYTAAQLTQLLGQLKLPARKLVRKKEAAAAGIDPAALAEDALIEAIDVLARLGQRLQDHSLERAVRVVLRDVLFDTFHAASSPSSPHPRPTPHL